MPVTELELVRRAKAVFGAGTLAGRGKRWEQPHGL